MGDDSGPVRVFRRVPKEKAEGKARRKPRKARGTSADAVAPNLPKTKAETSGKNATVKQRLGKRGKQHRGLGEQMPISNGSTGPRDRVTVCLQPNAMQRGRLSEILEAPLALASLVREYRGKITCASEASVFLLHNKKTLDGFIHPAARVGTVNLLTDLLIQWASDPPDVVGIDFDNASVSPSQEIFLPVPGLGLVPITYPSGLSELRQGCRWHTPFTLFQEAGAFSVTFELERIPRTVEGQRRPKGGKKRRAVPRIILVPGQPLPYISGMRYPKKQDRQRVIYSPSGSLGKGFKSMNWERLSGWAVSGGLPSLGRRAK